MENTFQRLCRFFASPVKVLGLAAGIGLAGTLLLLIAQPVYYRDAVCYTSMVQSLVQGNLSQAFLLQLPPLMTILAAPAALLGVDAVNAVLLVSSGFTILTIVPLYGLLTFFMERKYAAWGALFYILAPKILRFGLAPLLDGGRWFFFTLALYFVFSFVYGRRRWTTLIWLGVAWAGLTLIRSEGIVYVALFLGLFLLQLWQRDAWRFDFRNFGRYLLYLLLPLLLMSLLVLPRLLQVARVAGYPVVDLRQAAAIESVAGMVTGKSVLAERTVSGSLPLVRYADDEFQSRFRRNFLTGGYEVYLVLGGLGLFLLLRRRQFNFRYGIMLGWFLLNAFAFLAMQSVATRYFLINVIFLLPFTVYGYRSVFDGVQCRRRPVRAIFLPAVAVVAVCQFINGLDNVFPDRKLAHYKTVGLALRQELGRDVFRRAGTEYFVVLPVGRNYNWGYYARANMLMNDGFFTGGESVDWIDAAERGLPGRLAIYTMEKVDDETLLPPDFVIVDEPEKFEAGLEVLQALPGVRELPTGQESRVRVFRLTAPAAAGKG